MPWKRRTKQAQSPTGKKASKARKKLQQLSNFRKNHSYLHAFIAERTGKTPYFYLLSRSFYSSFPSIKTPSC